MVTVNLDGDLRERAVEEYGEEAVRQYEAGLYELGEAIHGEVELLGNIEDARGAHEEVSVESLRDQDYDSFEQLMDDVEERLEQLEAAIRLYAAQEYQTSEIKVPDELE